MAEIDGSIPASVKVPENNIGATFANLTALQGQILNNRMLGQKLNAANAVGRAIQSNIDDKGNFNAPGANLAIRSDPNAAMGAGDALKQTQDLATARVQQHLVESQASKADVEASLAKLEPTYGVVTSLIADPKAPMTKQAVTSALQQNLVDSGLISTPHDLALLQSHVDQLTDDPNQNRQMLVNWGISIKPTIEGMNLYRGAPQTLNTGPALVNMRPGGIAQGPSTQSAVSTGLTPGEKTDIVQTTNQQTGVVDLTPKGQLFDAYGNPTQGGSGGPGGASPASGAPAARNGRYPGAAASGGGPQIIGHAGLPPGSADIMAASSKAYQDDLTAVPELQKTLSRFDQARAALAGAQTGKGSEVLQNVRAVADTYGIPLPKADKDGLVKYAEFDKWSNDILSAESHGLGLNTDASREIQSHARPTTQTPHAAAVQMLPIVQGLRAMDLVAPTVAQSLGITPQQYTSWKSQWANSLDPLAFAAPYQNAADRQAYVKSLGPNLNDPSKWNDKQKRYAAGLQAGIDAKLFSAADLGK